MLPTTRGLFAVQFARRVKQKYFSFILPGQLGKQQFTCSICVT